MDEVDIITESWWSFLLRGLVALAFGIILIAYPSATAKAFFWIFGIFVLLYGLIDLIRGIVHLVQKKKWLGTFSWGLVSFFIGGIILGHLDKATSSIVWVMAILVGIWVIIVGVGELAMAMDLPPESGRGWLGVLGVFSILFGVVILVWPYHSVYALMVLIGIYAILAGLFDIFMSIYVPHKARQLKKEIEAA